MITKADVVTKFKELHTKCYCPYGYMISTVHDKISNAFYDCDRSSEFIWHAIYNRYASDRVRIHSCSVVVPLMGHKFKIHLDRPLEREYRSEFENYFGFGGNCKGYTKTRIVACYPEKIDDTIDIDEVLLNGSDLVDADYAKQVLMLIVLGGYVKSWEAVAEFEQWFINDVRIEDYIARNELLVHIFDTMEVVKDEI